MWQNTLARLRAAKHEGKRHPGEEVTQWSIHPSVHWFADSKDEPTPWFIDSLAHSLLDSLIYWIIDSSTHSFTRSLHHWFSGSLNHRFSHLFHSSPLQPIHFQYIHFVSCRFTHPLFHSIRFDSTPLHSLLSFHSSYDMMSFFLFSPVFHSILFQCVSFIYSTSFSSFTHSFNSHHFKSTHFISLQLNLNALIHVITGSFIHWIIASLLHCFTVLLIHWFIQLRIYFSASFHWHLNDCLLIDAPHNFNTSLLLHLKQIL